MGGYPNTPFFTDFSNLEKFLTFLGGKKNFFAKVPQYWSSSSKKRHCIFRYIRGGRGEGQTKCNKCYIFFEGVPKVRNFPKGMQNISEGMQNGPECSSLRWASEVPWAYMPFHELVCSMQFLSLSEQLTRIKESKHLEGIYLEEESEPCPVGAC